MEGRTEWKAKVVFFYLNFVWCAFERDIEWNSVILGRTVFLSKSFHSWVKGDRKIFILYVSIRELPCECKRGVIITVLQICQPSRDDCLERMAHDAMSLRSLILICVLVSNGLRGTKHNYI